VRAAIGAVALAIAVAVAPLALAEMGWQVEYQPSTIAPASPSDGWWPYGRTDSIHAGTRAEVCVDVLPPGTAAIRAWLARSPGVTRAETLACRLIAPPPGSGSRNIPPSDQTRYDTWSSHASGRGIDVHVSRAGGDRIVDLLLAPHDGDPHVVARQLGVLQLIWDGGCWEAREEQSRLSIHSAADMRAQYPCPAGATHRDHIHLTLSVDGASGTAPGYATLGRADPLALPPEFFTRGPRHYGRGG
jgi:hypothetical protein